MSATRIVTKYLARPSSGWLASSGVSIQPFRGEHSDGKSSDSDCSTKQAPKKRGKTPRGKLDEEYDEAPLSYDEKEPLEKHPGGVNPKTGEYGGPAGPEPTRYGDWERKGRVSDF